MDRDWLRRRLLALGADTSALLDEELKNTVGHVEEDQFEVDSILNPLPAPGKAFKRSPVQSKGVRL